MSCTMGRGELAGPPEGGRETRLGLQVDHVEALVGHLREGLGEGEAQGEV